MSASSTTSIFDLPPIVDTICRFLHPRDHYSVSLVNKTFHHGCKRYIWKKIVFKNTEDNEAISEEHQRTLLANSHWIQSLTVNKIHTPLVCLTDPSSLCTNLTFLNCNLEHRPSLYTASLAKLLTLNADIKTLKIQSLDDDLHIDEEDMPPNIDGLKQVVLALPYLRSLRYVSVEIPGCYGPLDLAIFMLGLPRSVKGFNFDQFLPKDNGMEEPSNYPQVQGLDWPSAYPNIRDLRFGNFEHYNLTSLIKALLPRCPRLKRLALPVIPGFELPSIAELLGDNCPNLWSLTIVGRLEEDELLPMVAAIPALTGLDLPIDVPTTATFVPRLIEKWSNTLTSLALGAGVTVQSSDIQLLLSSCHRLSSFWMTPHGGTFSPWTVSNHYSPLNLSDLAQSEWACLGLQELCIVLHDERVEQDTLDQHLEQEKRTQELIKKAYTQLGKLQKLRNLRLGMGHPFREGEYGDSLAIHKSGPIVHMDFSMASGLSLLKGIGSLRQLSLDGMARISVGSEELEWMQQAWPGARISGLNWTSADWLQMQRLRLNA
ncbi:hypothetical protein BGZ72_009490 [Mortierella alpina]|nr:hypothetical protein BGZ72_009490 [Mortierella alpina]